ncbi:MAG: hypothetical protein M3511_07315, partial [Deinococcota bacterium]|nr:hypothetical protein [Deinococcota bacterium]
MRGRARKEPAQLHIQLLGGFHVWTASEAGSGMKWRRKTASLVKLLALAHRLHCERVLESLWPELPAKAAANNLHYTLHLARHSLGNPPDLFLRFTDKVLV